MYFPGVLGRTCDRPCEPACRRGRVEAEPVAICRLKRVAADNKDDIRDACRRPHQKNGKRIALLGAGPASLTVARDLLPLGYTVVIYDAGQAGRRDDAQQIPKFRLPETVLDEECNYILDLQPELKLGQRIDSMKAVMAEDYDAIFVGSGAPRGRDLDVPGRKEAAANIHIGIDWLSSVSFGHIDKIGKRVIVLGGGNTAMDCCRPRGGWAAKSRGRRALRLRRNESLALGKRRCDGRGIPILNYLVPKEFTHDNGKLKGVRFEKVKAQHDAKGRRDLVPTGEPDVHGMRRCACRGRPGKRLSLDRARYRHRLRPLGHAGCRRRYLAIDPSESLFRRRFRLRAQNIIWAVAHGHEAAISIDLFCHGEDVDDRPPPMVTCSARKWASMNGATTTISPTIFATRFRIRDKEIALKNVKIEVELGFDLNSAFLKPSAASIATCRPFSPSSASNATPVSISARWIASPSRRTATRKTCVAPHRAGVEPRAGPLRVDGLKTGRVMVKDEDCAFIAACAPSAARRAHGICRNFILRHAQARMPACHGAQ